MSGTLATRGAVFCILLATPTLCATDFSTYRQLRLGLSTPAAVKLVDSNSAAVRLVHQRPELIEELTWRVSTPYGALSGHSPDPVSDVLLRFYNSSLFQMVVTYDRQKIQGLSERDLIELISKVYGPSRSSTISIPLRSTYGENAAVMAAWGDAKYLLSLVRTGDHSSFALVLTDLRVDELARKASREAERLDMAEAPARAIEIQAKQDERAKTALEKARSLNLPNFKP